MLREQVTVMHVAVDTLEPLEWQVACLRRLG